MSRKKAETGFAWVRCQVGEPIHDLAKYIRDRFGLPNVPLAYTYLLHFYLWGKDPEAIAQEMAASIGVTLPPLSEENPQLPLEEFDDEPTTE